MEKDCSFCKHYDFDDTRQCNISLLCNQGSQDYAQYDEVNSVEKTRRQCLLNAEQKDPNIRKRQQFFQNLTSILFGIIFLSAIIVIILLAISSFIHSWSHPEMTRMQVLQWSLSKYWIGYVYSIGVLLFSKFFISML